MNDLPTICASCGEEIRRVRTGKGKRSVTQDVCGCEPPKPKVSHKGRKRKGSLGESECVKAFLSAGWAAHKTALSGAAGTKAGEAAWQGDVVAKRGDVRLRIESKRMHRVPGLKSLLNMQSGCEVLWVREDNQEAHVLLPAKLFMELIRGD